MEPVPDLRPGQDTALLDGDDRKMMQGSLTFRTGFRGVIRTRPTCVYGSLKDFPKISLLR